jgi:hypothetical protein
MGISSVVADIANSGVVRRHLDKSVSDPKYLARFLLAGSISKDIFAYTMRVRNAEKNPEIPEDKKQFVIAMDKAMGVTTTVVQLVTGGLIASEKFQNYCSSKLFADVASDPRRYNLAKAGFASLSTLFGALILAKRIVVPMISTPLASYFMPKARPAGTPVGAIGSEVFMTQSKPSWFKV